jgi:hypothetical protein
MIPERKPTSELVAFVVEALDFGWPDNTVASPIGEFPHFWNTLYERDEWRYIDLWSGSSTDAGVQFVFEGNRPVWSSLYRGGLLADRHMQDLSMEANPVFGFLIRALRAGSYPGLPIRGPAEYVEAEWRYEFATIGDFDSYVATETITQETELVYERIFVGGRFGDGVKYGTSLSEFLT